MLINGLTLHGLKNAKSKRFCENTERRQSAMMEGKSANKPTVNYKSSKLCKCASMQENSKLRKGSVDVRNF